VFFTSMTIVSSAVLFRGFGSSNPTIIITVCLGFLGTIPLSTDGADDQ
jgi:hypothetical protein